MEANYFTTVPERSEHHGPECVPHSIPEKAYGVSNYEATKKLKVVAPLRPPMLQPPADLGSLSDDGEIAGLLM